MGRTVIPQQQHLRDAVRPMSRSVKDRPTYIPFSPIRLEIGLVGWEAHLRAR
jgi:hypothetical protein